MGSPCKNLFLTFLVWVLIDLSATFPRSKSTLFTNPSSRLNTSIHFHFSGSKRCAVVRALWRWKSWNRMRHTMHIWVCHHFQIWAAINGCYSGHSLFYFGEPIFQMWFGEFLGKYADYEVEPQGKHGHFPDDVLSDIDIVPCLLPTCFILFWR